MVDAPTLETLTLELEGLALAAAAYERYVAADPLADVPEPTDADLRAWEARVAAWEAEGFG